MDSARTADESLALTERERDFAAAAGTRSGVKRSAVLMGAEQKNHDVEPPLSAASATRANDTIRAGQVEDSAAALNKEEVVMVEDPAVAAEAAPPSAEDYACPICLELLLRPVALSCGHRLCRGRWIRVLQGSNVSLLLTGNVSCPLGRCQVRPTVPTVDVALVRELELRFGPQLMARTAEHTFPDEERMAKGVNAWAAAGCGLKLLHEVTGARAENEKVRALMPLVATWMCGILCIVLIVIFEPAIAKQVGGAPRCPCHRPHLAPPLYPRFLPRLAALAAALTAAIATALATALATTTRAYHRPQTGDRYAFLFIALGTSCFCTSLACFHIGPEVALLTARQVVQLRIRRGGAQVSEAVARDPPPWGFPGASR